MITLISTEHICFSTTDPEVRRAVLNVVLSRCVGRVVTVRIGPTVGISLTVAEPDPSHEPWHLYGTAAAESGHQSDGALPVIAYDAIDHVHIW